MIRAAKIEDAKAIKEIYNFYVRNAIATFEEVPVGDEEMRKRIQSVTSKYVWIVYEEHQQLLGYAYMGEWKSRSAYKYSVECAVYLKDGVSGRGIGSKLYSKLIQQAKDMNIHVMIGGISLPNDASVALHEKFGFEKIAHFKEVGYKFNQWIDVGYWQLLLNNSTE